MRNSYLLILKATAFPYEILLWILVGLAVFCLLMLPISNLVASRCVFMATLCRKNKEKWGRVPSSTDPESLRMDAEGMAWHEKHLDRKTDVHIQRNGLNLYGEYYDFGSERCVIVLSGRTESLRYGYYFAQPYADLGCNVLVVDPRAHGLSDGRYNTVGFEESRDTLAWSVFLHDSLGVRSVIYHGICIGAAAGMLAITSEDCPDYVEGMAAEGMFANFGESMKNHLIERKKPIFMLYSMINFWMKRYTGHSMDNGPIDVIAKMKKPLLMLHSKEDAYSRPEYARRLYDLAGSEQKRLVWYEEGKHSMLRPLDTEKYDLAVKSFVCECFSPMEQGKKSIIT
ncbi:MAG: alpha/beta hydrolase [Clostridia bacterium]|nr:alpha/beta hydrolase [Clostridia bacterium]